MKSLLSAAIAALLFVTAAPAQDLTRNRLEADIRFLADDLLEGRGTPSPGLEIAARYLEGELQKYGWQPGNGASYRQPYSLMAFEPRDASIHVSVDGHELAKDEYIFAPVATDPSRPIKGKVTIAGYGLDYPEKGVRDYAGLDVKNRVAIAFDGAPWPVDAKAFFGVDQLIGKIVAASGRGAALSVVVTPDLTVRNARIARGFGSGTVVYLPELNGSPTSGLASVLVLPATTFDKYLAKPTGRTYAGWLAAIAKKKKTRKAFDTTVRVDITVTPSAATATNVVAKLEGSDPLLKDEWVILTAHYDHLGARKDPEGKLIVMNGADDNASGTAAVLEVARRLAAGPRPKRSVLVLLVSGEERGLVGSSYYSIHPLVPYANVVANVNVDMVGRSDGTVQAITQSSQLFRLASEQGARAGIKVLPDQQPTWRVAYFTDSYHFSRFDVPAVEFFTGLHDDYHGAGDDADKIRFAELASIITVMYDVAHAYADGAPRAAVERPEWYVTAP